jgi:hypothetical protein
MFSKELLQPPIKLENGIDILGMFTREELAGKPMLRGFQLRELVFPNETSSQIAKSPTLERKRTREEIYSDDYWYEWEPDMNIPRLVAPRKVDSVIPRTIAEEYRFRRSVHSVRNNETGRFIPLSTVATNIVHLTKNSYRKEACTEVAISSAVVTTTESDNFIAEDRKNGTELDA